MNSPPKISFELQTMSVALDDLCPLRQIKEPQKIMR